MMAKNMVEHLLRQKMIKPLIEKEKLINLIENTITSDVMVEEELNQEVRELMKNHSEQIEKGEVDYNRLFQMIKQKLARERGLVL